MQWRSDTSSNLDELVPLLCRSPQYVTGPGTLGTTLWTSADDQTSLWLLTYINRRLQGYGFTSETWVRGFIDIEALP